MIVPTSICVFLICVVNGQSQSEADFLDDLFDFLYDVYGPLNLDDYQRYNQSNVNENGMAKLTPEQALKTLVPLDELDKNRFQPVTNKMEAEFKLRKWLFKDYNPNLKPSEMPGAEIIIKISIVIDQILELTIKQESLRARIIIRHEWEDQRLYWDHMEEFYGIDYIHVNYDMIWSPEIILHNNADGIYMPESFKDFKMILYSNGTIIYSPMGIFTSHCNINVRDFPYDEQICSMFFTTMVYSSDVVRFEAVHGFPLVSQMKTNPEWNLVNSKIVEVKRREHEMSPINQTLIKCSLHLVRKPLFYTIYILLPTIAITSMVISVFHSPSMGGEKITLSISGLRMVHLSMVECLYFSCLILNTPIHVSLSQTKVLLALTFFLNLVSGLTPRTSTDIPLVSKYLMFSMVLVSLSVVCSVCISNVHHRTPAIHTMPEWLHSLFLDTLPNVLLMKKPICPKPIFPVGHRFSISNEYPHQFNTYVPPEPPQEAAKPLELSPEQMKLVSGRVSPKIQKKRIKFLPREDTLFQPTGCSTNSDTDSITSSLSSTSRRNRAAIKRLSKYKSNILHGLEPEKILNSNRVVRMIADHEKIEDELANGVNDWIFLGLVIDRVLLLIFILSFAFGSCMLFYGLQEAEFTVDSEE